ncbi:MAG TPA: universal stress protein [Candidatus Margulisiibacteriota bacterium]|nr:universal stress protein [Candidatus Margulisiibacteriota bacterium]
MCPAGVADVRPRPEDFLELVERGKRGRLKVYIGFAAGVGKTYRMLEEAHALRKRGVDVVLGFIETHGRAETAALIDGLEYVPRRKVEYRGLVVEEMALDAVIARRPQVALVDEVAHTNTPDARNRKRYQDVLDILAAGINVICAFNVQHLESLKDIVERATNVVIRETVPDSFLKQADQVVNLDLAAEDLLERLRAGKIYDKEKVEWALAHFFKEGNLATLRELALREVAESLDRTIPTEGAGVSVPRGASGRLMVCISSFSPRAATLLRRGSRMAGRLNTDWYVAYVETPAEAPHLIDAEAQRHLLANIEKARELGAVVVRLQGADPVPALLNYARTHHVGHVMIGRSHRPWWQQVFGRSFVVRMVREAAHFDLHIIAHEDEEERA